MRFPAPVTRFGAWLALGCHVLVASGLPLVVSPAPRGATAAIRGTTKDRSRPFPCMDKPCGCATAEQCFARCCCHTPAQRLAWARAHRVEPAVVAALERRVAAAAAPAAACCAARPAARACCAAAAAAEAPDVCRDYRSLAAEPAAPPAPDDHDDAPRTVILRDMLACGGIASGWLACGIALLPPARVSPPSAGACVGFVALGDDSAASVAPDLSPPPPRVT